MICEPGKTADSPRDVTSKDPDLASASDWMEQVFNQSEASATQIWVVTRHQYGISAVVLQTRRWCREMSAVFADYDMYNRAQS